ncbi:hypothetical protein [Desulfonatronum thiodismutans]|uniref:hypothetical protein n=1 Tax=Desulfonatronum thiodismutans TaxID=159290 RepID=UPI0004ABD727|nr:hypothetical protein [Desulfonatronum thiodismutans]
MQHYEYIGEVLPDGRLPIAPSIAKKLIPGQRIRVRIEQIPDAPIATGKKELDAATLRLLERMKNARPLGAPDDPESLRHSVLFEERMEEKFPWRG